MAEEEKEEEPVQETRSIKYRIDLRFDGNSVNGGKSVYMSVTGVPKDLPEEYESALEAVAESNFAKALNSYKWIEVFDIGHSIKDSRPAFWNTDQLTNIQITDIKKVED